jgi:hypothetical protein
LLYATLFWAILLGALRLCGFKGEVFQALVHLFVGGLFVAFCLRKPRWSYGAILVALSLLEVVCFLRDQYVGF